jgi:DNA-binding MarR family transcriptional regulator
MKVKKVMTKVYRRKEPSNDYMKYWRVIRYWAKDRYGFTYGELDVMFFLYSEGLFSRAQFDEFNQLTGFNNVVFEHLRRDGWIAKWRNQYKNEGALYEVSFKGKRAITNIYDKLNGKEFSERVPMFNQSPSYNDKLYRKYIKKINKSIQQQQRLSQE